MCRHLVDGVGLGFVEPCGPQDADASDEQAAWCDACEEARLAGGGWTPASEARPGCPDLRRMLRGRAGP